MQAGTRLDHYEIIDLLGEGGMGAVYRAEDTRLKRQVAIKVLPRELAADPERLARLEREAQLLASLNHPNVATVHGFGDVQADVDGEQQRVTFLVMELVEGESLYERAKMGPMPWREVVEIGIGIAAGLDAAHEQGIVHRDLKPANVHVLEDGTVKVLDFGLAKAFEGDGSSAALELSASPTMAAATRTGVILGTAAYMSPEQARGKKVDKRADIWALGCVLYELLAGHKTFDGETVSDILAAILREEPDLDALPSIPPSLRHVLDRCLQKQPAQRMRDVGDVRLELEIAREEKARPADAAGARSGTSWKLAAALATLAAFLGSGAGYVLRSADPPAPEARVVISTDAISAGLRPLAISPDGRWIAEVGAGTGIRMRPLNDLAWRSIPGTEAASAVVFSADSQQIYFSAGFQTAESTVHRVDLHGTSPVLLATLPGGFADVFRALNGQIAVAHTDFATQTIYLLETNGSLTEVVSVETTGTAILFSTQVDATHWLGWEVAGPNSTIGLALVDSSDDSLRRLLPDLRTPLHVGDGRLLAVDARGRLVSARIDIDTGDVIDPPTVRVEGLSLASGIAGAYSLAEDGTLVYLAGETGGGGQYLAWLSPDGSTERISEREIHYQVDTFPSPDGTRIAAELQVDGSARITIHIHEIERDISAPLVPGSASSFPVWSPNSQHVAFFLDDGEASGIYRAPIDRSELPALLLAKPADAFVLPMDWSPDGSMLMYVLSSDLTRSQAAPVADLWILPLDGAEPQPYLATDAREVDGRFSPDGRWIAYESDHAGAGHIYVRALEGGGEYQISADRAMSPEWNVRGDKLYFYSGPNLVEVDIDVSGATPAVSTERAIIDMTTRFRARLFAPAPDGERFLVAEFASDDATQRAIHAIFNWDFLRHWE